ncbi:MAG: thioredoxin family protein [Planctomycetota bacterium]|jgi:thioredoxin 1
MPNRNVNNVLIVLAVVAVVVGVAWFKSFRRQLPATETQPSSTVAVDESPMTVPASTQVASTVTSAPQEEEKPKPAEEVMLPRMVDLGAHKCIPCKLMAPILKELKAEYAGRAEIEFIDVWKNPGAGRKYGIRAIPTQIFYSRHGKEVWRHEGFLSKVEIVAKLKELGV